MYRMRSMTIVLVVAVLMVVVIALAISQGVRIMPAVPPAPGTVATPVGDPVAKELVDITVETAESTANTLQNFLDRLTSTPKSDIARILLVVGGVILLVVGWRIYDFIVLIAGFLIGAAIAVSLLTTDSPLIVVAAILIGGLLGVVLSTFVYYAAVFVIGAYVGVVLTNALANALSLTPVSGLALLVGGVIGGVVLLGLSFEFLVLIASLVGAQMLSLGLGLGITWTVIFAVMGVILQLMLMRGYRHDFRRRRRPVRFYRRPAI